MTTTHTADTAPAAPEAPKERARGIGTVAREAIKAGKTNEQALADVQREFPDSRTTLATISWYRNDLRKTDPSIPAGRAAKKAIEPAEAPAKDPLEG